MSTSRSFVSTVVSGSRAHRSSAAVLLAALSLAVLAGSLSLTDAFAQAPPRPGGGLPPRHTPLAIVGFTAENVAIDTWLVQGQVTGCSPLDGIVINFGGLAEGQQVSTGSDGTFLLFLVLPPSLSGDLSATATCQHGRTSNTINYYIDNS